MLNNYQQQLQSHKRRTVSAVGVLLCTKIAYVHKEKIFRLLRAEVTYINLKAIRCVIVYGSQHTEQECIWSIMYTKIAYLCRRKRSLVLLNGQYKELKDIL